MLLLNVGWLSTTLYPRKSNLNYLQYTVQEFWNILKRITVCEMKRLGNTHETVAEESMVDILHLMRHADKLFVNLSHNRT
jgi:hypothetical protein